MSVGDDVGAVSENRRRVAAAFDLEAASMVTTRQVHGADTIVVDEIGDMNEHPPRADALATTRSDVLLMQRFADCVPVLLASVRKPAVAVAHAGWRGTVAQTGGVAVRVLTDGFGVSLPDIYAGIGPSIGPCCYEVGHDVAEQLKELAPNVVLLRQPRPHLDLWEANRQVLIRAGVSSAHIEVSGICTQCNSDTYFSHRALGYPAGRFGAVIGLRP